MSDGLFLRNALQVLNELRETIVKDPKSNVRLDQFVTDLHVAGLRYLKGNHCSNPGCVASAQLPELSAEAYCSMWCQERAAQRKQEDEDRIAEASSQYTQEI